ncbi:hypothetical protein Q9L58_006085 [Maublancomyces gigas]|uniref:BTB domain-containing protein n=1 Tax=Discina gigas TaxID=1032678 RepID=A0ABR3GGB7_9PEZI
MSTQISGRLGSEIFELSAEAGQKSFFVHKNLLVEQSELLRTAVKQAADRKIDLGSWDGETVSHLVDFLYLHTYKVKTPEPLCPTGQFTESTISDTSETDSRSDTPDTVRDRSQDAIHRRPLTPLRELIESHDAQNNPAGCNPAPAEVEDSYSILYPLETHEYSGILFAHANVYALAQSLGIDDLQRMAYRSLAVILDSFKPIDPESHIATITIELLSHVYGNTRSLGDPMRILVSQFAALNFPALQRMDQMKELVRQGGELVVDLVEKRARDNTSGHATSGHATFGHATSGHAISGHANSGHAISGHTISGHPTSGHAISGHAISGHSISVSDAHLAL